MAARKKKRSSKASSTRKKSTKRPVKRKSAPRKKTASSVQLGMSLDRKLDIAGVITAAAGLLTIIALASGSESGLGALWVGFLQRWLGWGIYILPVGLVFAGLWLALRKAERVPAFVVERVVGLLLLFLNLLAWLHALSFPADTAEAYALAESGGGGGLIGAWLLVLLENGLGVWGAGIALFGWLLIAAALSLDVSILELFRWVGPMVLRLQDAWDERRARQNELQPTLPFSPPPEAPPPVMEASPAVKSAGMKEVPVDGQLPTEGHLQDTQPLVVWELPVVGEMLA
ncbi:MAG: DNA translocase FtsK 4TM domain-containing protein, partial [Anaerolineae bacterium]|nr:DNA translocase FtsK 4TM domain-containing protein [Anaerolineae bacterium]